MYKAGHPQITSGQAAGALKPASVLAEGHGVDHEAILTWPISSHLWLSLNEPQGMPTVWKIETLRLRLKTLLGQYGQADLPWYPRSMLASFLPCGNACGHPQSWVAGLCELRCVTDNTSQSVNKCSLMG